MGTKKGKKNGITNLHDNFFRATFERRENARDFLLAELPKELSDAIDFSSITIVQSTHLNRTKDKKIFSDLVVRTELKATRNPAEIYILFEHKTDQKERIFYQLLSYMTAMWQKDVDDAEEEKRKIRYRVIIPVVFYHGAKKWKIARQFSDMFSVDDSIKRYLLNFSYSLFDTNRWNLTAYEREKLHNNIFLITSILFMKATYQNNMESIVTALNLWHKSDFFRTDKDVLVVYINYLVRTKKLDENELERLIEETDLEKEDVMPNAIDTWVERGVQQGMQQGVLSVARQMLLNGSDVAFVVKVTNLSIEKVREIQKSL
ncbi:Rpn family recombination-promoting nuclease/putative transposase [bacterium]|nr:Rpn family recombination-promoting nuclease/putative transposase [bacterium]